jgi:hypothetical protein
MSKYDQLVRKVLNNTVQPLLERKLILEELATTEFEGEITGKEGGDTVIVVYGSDVTLRTYTNGQQLTYDQPAPSTHEIRVNTGKYFVHNLSTFEEKQLGSAKAGALLKDFAHRASYKFAKSIEDDVAGLYTSAGMVIDNSGHYTNGGADISNASALSITSSNVYEFMSDMQVLMDESDIAPEGRFAVLPAWMCAKLNLDDRNVYTEKMIDNQNTGKIKFPVCGFEVFKSNSVKVSSTTYYPLFGVKKKSFAVVRQINPTAQDASRPDRFEKATKMAILYGVDCHRSDMLACGVVSKGAE